MKFFFNCIALLSLLALISCGSGGKSSTKLEINRSFSAADFSGGLIITGSNADGTKKVSIAFDGVLEKTVELDRSVWTFTAVGWDGATKFVGSELCGSTTADLNSDSATVSLVVNSANCTAAFKTAVDFKYTMITACGLLQSYNSITDTYSPLTNAAVDDAFCSTVPQDFRSSMAYYRVFSVNSNSTSTALGFSSGCALLGSTVRYSLPTQSIPLVIRTYKSMDECSDALNPRSQTYTFPSGLATGNISVFDSHFTPTAVAPQARLSLASSLTRRGYSPFMNMLPRILCGSDDCLPTPIGNVYDYHIPWTSFQDNNNRKKLIARSTGLKACPTSNFFENMQNFSLDECSVEDGDIMASFSRNEFACTDSSAPINGIQDMTEKDGLVYIAIYDRVRVFTKKGKFLFDIGTGTGNSKIAVNEGKDIFLIRSSGVTKILWNAGTQSYNPEVSNFILGSFSTIEAMGGFVFVTQGNSILSYKIDGNLINTSPSALAYTPKSLFYKDGLLFALTSQTGTTQIVNFSIANTGAIGTMSVPLYNAGLNASDMSFLSSNNHFYILTDSTIVELNASFGIISTKNTAALFNSATVFLMTNPTNSLIVSGSTLKVGSEVSGNVNDVTITAGLCSNSITWIAGTRKDGTPITGAIVLRTKSADSVYQVFSDLLEFFGRRTLSNQQALTYFDVLDEHGKDDETKTDGKLGDVQQMLSSQGIGSLFSDYATCEALRNSLSPGKPLTRSVSLSEPGTSKSMKVTVTVERLDTSVAVNDVDHYICKDADPNATTCSIPATRSYDLMVNFQSVGADGEKEKTELKLLCSSKLGRFERVSNKLGEITRSVYLYNTNDTLHQRFDEFKREDKSKTETYVSATRLMKNMSDYWARNVSVNLKDSTVQANIKEVQYSFAGSSFMSHNFHLSDTLALFGTSHGVTTVGPAGDLFDDIRDQGSFGAMGVVADNCMLSPNTDVEATPIVCGTLLNIAPSTMTSAGIDLTPFQIYQAKTAGHVLNYPSSVFTLLAP